MMKASGDSGGAGDRTSNRSDYQMATVLQSHAASFLIYEFGNYVISAQICLLHIQNMSKLSSGKYILLQNHSDLSSLFPSFLKRRAKCLHPQKYHFLLNIQCQAD